MNGKETNLSIDRSKANDFFAQMIESLKELKHCLLPKRQKPLLRKVCTFLWFVRCYAQIVLTMQFFSLSTVYLNMHFLLGTVYCRIIFNTQIFNTLNIFYGGSKHCK